MSKEGNRRKDELLEEPHGTACGRLRKSLLFSCIQRLREDRCHKCGEVIASESELSIEHKTPWQRAENPRESFFDLSNVAFSHLKCNVRIRTRMSPDEKRAADAESRRRWRLKYGPVIQVARREKYLRNGT